MQFCLVGFTHDLGFRVFSFEGVDADRKKLAFSVRADLALARQFGIALQELPQLCGEVLKRYDETGAKRSFTYTEEDMRAYSTACAAARAAAAEKRKVSRRPPAASQSGAGWRVPPPPLGRTQVSPWSKPQTSR